MKTLLASILFLLFAVSTLSAQKRATDSGIIFKNLEIDLKVDGKKDFENVDFETIKSLFQNAEGERLAFTLGCEKPYESSFGNLSNFSYSVMGRSDELDAFLTKVEKAKNTFQNLYK